MGYVCLSDCIFQSVSVYEKSPENWQSRKHLSKITTGAEDVRSQERDVRDRRRRRREKGEAESVIFLDSLKSCLMFPSYIYLFAWPCTTWSVWLELMARKTDPHKRRWKESRKEEEMQRFVCLCLFIHTCLMHCSLSLVCWMCRSIDGNVFILMSLPGRH